MELKFFENRTEDQLVSEVHVTHAAVVVEMDGKVLYVKKRGKSTLELPSIDAVSYTHLTLPTKLEV